MCRIVSLVALFALLTTPIAARPFDDVESWFDQVHDWLARVASRVQQPFGGEPPVEMPRVAPMGPDLIGGGQQSISDGDGLQTGTTVEPMGPDLIGGGQR